MAKSEAVLSAVIAATADGDNTIVAAPAAGYKIRVLGYILNVNAAGTVQWKSGAATAKSGAMEFVDGGGMVAPMCDPTAEVFWFETVAGEALNITTAAGVDALGHVTYQLI
jgi:glyoxylate utilization-related uncharacterized protein